MFKEKPFNVLLFCSVVTVSTAVLQYLYPQFSFLVGGLITAILLTIFLKKDLYTKIFGVVSLVLIVVATFYPNDAMTRQQVIMQQLFSAIIVLLTIISVLYVKKLYGSIESDQQQVTALFEHATEGIILTNQKGEIVLINPAALGMFGYKKDELQGKSIEVLIPGRFKPNHHKYREGFYKAPSNRSMGHGRDLFARMKDGTDLPVEVSLSYYKQKDEFFVIAFVVDITQRKESERRLIEQKEQLEKVSADIRKLNAELENKVEERTLILKEALQELEKSQQDLSEALNKEKELNEIKSRFVSTASHEFRTPLSTVLSSAALLSKYVKTEEQDKRERHIRRIKDSVKHLNDLLEDLLSLGKLEEGKVETKPEVIGIKDFLDEIAEEMKAIAKPGQQIMVELEGDAQFSTDKKLLKNILINLLSNAVKFSPEQGVITLKARNTNNQMVVAVKDQGIGISEEDQQHLFSSFYRGKNAINIPGTGLGLHIVKGYVELLHGTINVHSVLDEGTTITIDLPALTLMKLS
jgi:PAS domain S-box-containing protein